MSKILDLREKRTKAWEAAKSFLDTKQNADGGLSPEDAAAYDKMESEVVALGKDIERLERAREIENDLSIIIGDPLVGKPGSAVKTGLASDSYKLHFWNKLRGRAVPENALKEGTDPEGGYLVPDEFEHRLIEALEEQNLFRRLATVIQTSSGDRKIPIVATKGIAAWVEEEGTIPDSDDSFGQVSLSAYKVATMMKISQELLSDSAFPLEPYVTREFARRIGTKEEDAFFNGDGSGKPTGIFAATGGAPIGKTAASATAVTLDEVLDLFYALKSPYRARAVFVASESVTKAIRKLKDSNGQYLWQPSIQDGSPDKILGKPIYTSEFVPTLATGAKCLAFGDFSFYWIADRQPRTLQRLNELYAPNGQVGFIATQRVDGKLILPEAIQVLQTATS